MGFHLLRTTETVDSPVVSVHLSRITGVNESCPHLDISFSTAIYDLCCGRVIETVFVGGYADNWPCDSVRFRPYIYTRPGVSLTISLVKIHIGHWEGPIICLLEQPQPVISRQKRPRDTSQGSKPWLQQFVETEDDRKATDDGKGRRHYSRPL